MRNGRYSYLKKEKKRIINYKKGKSKKKYLKRKKKNEN